MKDVVCETVLEVDDAREVVVAELDITREVEDEVDDLVVVTAVDWTVEDAADDFELEGTTASSSCPDF